MCSKGKLATAALLAAAMAQPALAEETGPWEKASIAVGGMLTSMDGSARVGAAGAGLEIDLENVLGLETSQSAFRVDALYRFGKSRRHRLDFTWFDLDRDATRTLETEIELDGVTYPVGTTVQSEFDLAFYNVRYSYSFIQDDRVDFAGSVGFHITDIGLSVSSATQGTTGEDVTAPLPLLGLRLDVLLTRNWYMRSSLEALYLAFDGFKGAIVDSTLALEYRPWKRFALGTGLNSVRVLLEGEEDSSVPGIDLEAKFDFRYTGLLLYGKLLF
jgi:hypothetical protein